MGVVDDALNDPNLVFGGDNEDFIDEDDELDYLDFDDSALDQEVENVNEGANNMKKSAGIIQESIPFNRKMRTSQDQQEMH